MAALKSLTRLLSEHKTLGMAQLAPYLESLSTSSLAQHVKAYATIERLVQCHRSLLGSQLSTMAAQQHIQRAVDNWQRILTTAIDQHHFTLAMASAHLLTSFVLIHTSAGHQQQPLHPDDPFGQPLLHCILQQTQRMPMLQLCEDKAQCRFYTMLQSRLLSLLNEQETQEAFARDLDVFLQQRHFEVMVPLLRQYAWRLPQPWLTHTLLPLLPQQINAPGHFCALLQLLFVSCEPTTEVTQAVWQQLMVFGQWQAPRFAANGWELYRIAMAAGHGSWYSIMADILHGLEPMVRRPGPKCQFMQLFFKSAPSFFLSR
ncbi:hypothetical protein DM01DRAFT_1142490 [Hesseltinella vesiculosa]|uniref:Uncharacterized protein n=1 Tax=Hesseltinella vesiculosa TaxID=101127 RepID=A0A1X2G7U2_9FUNG|nr:hypothetical protein DM01DRAFT_1142490 [Hesseltinella vesiculosa]